LTGAAASHAFSNASLGTIATPLVLLLIAAASWALRPPSRTFATASPRMSPRPVASPNGVAAHA
jgi:hypothetical protein